MTGSLSPLNPLWFVVGFVAWLALIAVACVLARIAALADERPDLPVPAGASDPPRRARLALLPAEPGRPCRDGQHRAAAQERAARDALAPRAGLVAVSPLRCPVNDERTP